MYRAAPIPEFCLLDGADHLLSDKEDSRYAGGDRHLDEPLRSPSRKRWLKVEKEVAVRLGKEGFYHGRNGAPSA